MDKIVNIIIRNSIKRNFNQLGIEGCLEFIERIKNPVYRARMRELHLRYLKEVLLWTIYYQI